MFAKGNICNGIYLQLFCNSSTIRRKGETQNGCYKKIKHTKFSERQTFLTPSYAHVRVRI